MEGKSNVPCMFFPELYLKICILAGSTFHGVDKLWLGDAQSHIREVTGGGVTGVALVRFLSPIPILYTCSLPRFPRFYFVIILSWSVAGTCATVQVE